MLTHLSCFEELQRKWVKAVVAVVVVVEDFPISDLDDSSYLDCIFFFKDHNYSAVVGFAVEGVYYKCLQHRLQVAH